MNSGEPLIIRTRLVIRIVFTALFLILGWAGYDFQKDATVESLHDAALLFKEALLAFGGIVCLAFAWLQKIELTHAELRFCRPGASWTLLLGDIEFVKFGTYQGLKDDDEVRHFPRVAKAFAYFAKGGDGNPPLMIVKPRSMAGDAYIVHTRPFDPRARGLLIERLAMTGVTARF